VRKRIHFNVGAGIVADSDSEAEYEETPAKVAGFLAALQFESSIFLSQKPVSRQI
jgi:anthranilate/para-aminobenzoate synthase component I